ncbi:MEKHLA domain-containing protein [Phormidium sp. CLA17]|uniref:MEKHLA domain-containing protein n=1 Tax=Leptolyngbya sp. Cla-17 TaxID=2803751 RepID=UPI0014912FBF|nr:MEKHLA domain-containing protein [Leptolyngbya sp. Cla-17]MBM0743351.1 MEKHLA domain-containing protein [Leptolyngbya sp. Cla-17]
MKMQEEVIRHTHRLLHSFHHWTGVPLLVNDENEVINNGNEATVLSEEGCNNAQALFEAPFVVVSHGTEADPIFNYGNRQALRLWQMEWDQFTQTPSRLTAEPMEWADRDRLLQQANANGFINNYQGVRICSTGQRFSIHNVILWNVIDEKGDCCGQAATFDQWNFL